MPSTADAGAARGRASTPLPPGLEAEANRHGAGDAQAGLDKRQPDSVAEVVGAGAALKPGQVDQLFEAYSRSYDSVSKREELLDAGSEMSFPASDPPSYMAGASVAGAPGGAPGEKPSTEVSDASDLKPPKEPLPLEGDRDERDASGGYNRPSH